MGDSLFQWLKGHVLRLIGPAPSAFIVAPNDVTVFPQATRGLWVGGTGNVVVRMLEGQNIVPFNNVPGGTLLPIRVDQVLAVGSGTSATNIVAVY